MSVRDDLREARKKADEGLKFSPADPMECIEWVEINPVQVAVNRITGERVFLDPQDGMWRYLPTKEEE